MWKQQKWKGFVKHNLIFTPPPPPTYGTLPCTDVEGKQLVFTLRGIGVCKPWQQALTVVQIVFFGVSDDELINTKLIKRVLNKQIDGILLGSSLGHCFLFFFIMTELKNDIVRKMLDSGLIYD